MKQMKKGARIAALILAVFTLAPLTLTAANAAYAPPYTALRIGLFFDSTELPSANLQNVDGLGSGFEFGYFNNRNEFVSIGAWTDETRISMMMDRNMSWVPGAGGGAGEYQEGASGSVVVGCYHVQLNAGYDTFEDARTEAQGYQDAFVRYQAGRFLVLIGQYASRAGAEGAQSSLDIRGTAINSGTQYTITVAKTGTNMILFEYDMGETGYLGVMPRPTGDERPETLFRNNRYNGGFQYARRGGMLLTVVNYVEIEDYVKGILPYEMSNSWPLEALKAQALCARTYAMSSLNKHNSSGFDLCTTEHCQVYRGRDRTNATTDRAVEETAGMYVTYEGELTQTFYAASNGGASESSENVWAQPLPYLRGVIDTYETSIAANIPNYYWTITYTPAEITQRLRSRGYECATIVSMVVSQFSPTGNVVAVTMTDSNGRRFVFSRRSQLITALGISTQRFTIGNQSWEQGSYFANDPAENMGSGPQFFVVDDSGATVAIPGDAMYAITSEDGVVVVEGEISTGEGGDTNLINGVFTIRGSGRGHSVGMSQWGAYAMANNFNMSYIDIIQFYFAGVEITQTLGE